MERNGLPGLVEVAGGVIIAHGVGDCIELLEGDAGLEVLAQRRPRLSVASATFACRKVPMTCIDVSGCRWTSIRLVVVRNTSRNLRSCYERLAA